MMKKVSILILSLFLTPVVAGLYGILHDQLTYSISHEYYTKFKFIQFGLAHDTDEAILTNPRQGVAIVGFMATWWVGIFIGLVHGLTGLIHKDYKRMLEIICKATVVTLVIAFVTALLGFAYGKFVLVNTGVDWWLPDNVVDKENFIAVGSIHNFSYLGGLFGLIVGVVYQIWQKRKEMG